MKKRLPLLLLLLLLTTLLAAPASAERHLDMIAPIYVDDIVSRSTAQISGPSAVTTGQTYTWSTTYEPGDGYSLQWYVATEQDEDGKWNVSRVFDGSSFSWQPDSPCSGMIFLGLEDAQGSVNFLTTFAFTATGTDYIGQNVAQLAAACLAEAGADEYEQSLWLHDWLTHNADYDYDYTQYGPEGVLLYGTGVCDSFSKAYVLLLNAVGIENVRVTSDAMCHAWNYLKIDGQWYETDVTWDDANRYAYFNLTSRMMSVDHYDRSVTRSCTSLAANYFYRKGLGDVLADHLVKEIFGTEDWTELTITAADSFCRSCLEDAGYAEAEIVDVSIFNGRLDLAADALDGAKVTDADGYKHLLTAALTTSGDMLVTRTSACRGAHQLSGSICIVCGERFDWSSAAVLTLPADLTTLGSEALSGVAAQYIFVPDSCTSIAADAFNGESLELVILPATMTDLADALVQQGITVGLRVGE